MNSPRPLPTVIGPTENALRALLARILASTRIPGYPGWVVLSLAASPTAAQSNGDWRSIATDALKVGPDEVDRIRADLCTAGLMNEAGQLTDLGVAELATARQAVSDTTARLVDGIEESSQQVARRVLDKVRSNAEALLRD